MLIEAAGRQSTVLYVSTGTHEVQALSCGVPIQHALDSYIQPCQLAKHLINLLYPLPRQGQSKRWAPVILQPSSA